MRSLPNTSVTDFSQGESGRTSSECRKKSHRQSAIAKIHVHRAIPDNVEIRE